MAQAGAHTEAQAVTFSVALEDVAGCTTSTPTNKEAARGNLRSKRRRDVPPGPRKKNLDASA